MRQIGIAGSIETAEKWRNLSLFSYLQNEMIGRVKTHNPLLKQLDEQRYLHAVAYVQSTASSLKKLTTSELVHLNQMLTGEQSEPWRFEEASVQIPSGRTHQFNVVSNPVVMAREVLGDTQQIAGNQDYLEAAFRLYSQLVLHHLFRDANRRTAVLATLWLLLSHGVSVEPQKLVRVAIGDLRESADLTALREQLRLILAEC